jgi:thiol-disulfide isomerase/thioredoxin
MNARSVPWGVALLVLVAGGAGFLAFEMTRARHVAVPIPPSTPVVDAAGAAGNADAPAAEPPPTAPRTIPETLPAFTLPDRDGVPRQLSHWRDRPLMVNFWATWCAPCRREIPLLRQLRRERTADGLEVIGIAVDERPAVLDYARKIGIDYPLLIGEQGGMDAAAAFGMDVVFPFTIFADRAQRIVTVKVGELHADEASFILDRIDDVDAHRLALPAAQAQIADRLRELAVARARREQTPAF